MTAELPIPCVGCGYDVRSLASDGVCPECGTQIARSLAGDALALADPRWLKRTIRGQRLLSFGLSLTFFGALAGLAMLILFFSLAFLVTDRPDVVISITYRLVQAALAIGLLVATVGSIMVTTMDPRETDRESTWSARRLARGGMAAAVGLLVLSLGSGLGGLPGMRVVDVALKLAAFGAFTIGLVASLRWFAQLASRVPEAQLAMDLRELAKKLRNAILLLIACVLGERLLTAAPAMTGRFKDLDETWISFLQMAGGLMDASIKLLVLVASVQLLLQSVRLVKMMGRMRRALESVQPESPSDRPDRA